MDGFTTIIEELSPARARRASEALEQLKTAVAEGGDIATPLEELMTAATIAGLSLLRSSLREKLGGDFERVFGEVILVDTLSERNVRVAIAESFMI